MITKDPLKGFYSVGTRTRPPDSYIDGIRWGNVTVSIKWAKDKFDNEDRSGACVLRYGAITAMYPSLDVSLSVSVDGHIIYIPCDNPQALMDQLQDHIELWWAKHD